MKKLSGVLVVLLLLCSCGANKYHLSRGAKSKQNGYHHNTAKKIVDENAKNRHANQKHTEQHRQQLNKQSAQQAAMDHKTKKHHGHFGFYFR
ncbi:MAG: hypothetical protein MUE33_05615 [Cytophagaceae bacterium]|jgi:hypothetical protein|nr:hypothetical protein [Cytophagaceae bacterium]